jgi:ferredoxin-NADP reductase
MTVSCLCDIAVTDHAEGGSERHLSVAAVTDVAAGVRAFELMDPDAAQLAPWAPGAHVDVTLPTGEVRQYSLCSDPEDLRSYRIAVLRVELPTGRGGSCWLHDQVSAGDLLEVGEPRNTFELPVAGEYLLLAGGIGITPLAAMARSLHRRGADWRLVYGARSRDAMALVDELMALDPARVELVPQDELGILELDRLLVHRPGQAVMCCGPAPMLDAVTERCAGWPDDAVHIERFTASPASTAAGGDRAFDVELARSGLRLRVAADQTLLDAMRGAGLDPPCSCEQGICGTCETAVLAGQVDHRDQLLTDTERASNHTMMLCVSRAADDFLILDC